jgi:thioredoxin-dependent peroxiredoxin
MLPSKLSANGGIILIQYLIATFLSLFMPMTAWVQLPEAKIPVVGEKAVAITLKNISGKAVSLSDFEKKSQVVLVVLRGYPGYQCPVCNVQVQELIKNETKLAEAGAKVLMVYPGPSENLQSRAEEFLKNKQWPASFELLLDPDYKFTNQYGLRWDAKNETAYPSTFVIDRAGKITFAKISKTHGGRANSGEILAALTKM